ncbi:Clp protease N-terminal domain-containing protein [Streptomyces sp. NBC_01483]|uniref:Clp protease N-terminal domain-containing protein n=1 Tax=Streptomyces sp. NBC_01483 TaxID=2903883 RepID=UPI002E2FF6A8|nr:Clp protease N-terminal domain-containing protein [Streptomyces sp. NBC_01483]
MPPRIPQQPAAESGSHRTELDARLSAELVSVVSGARRRALRDGDRQIDTAHLLHSLLEAGPEVGAVFDGAPQVARLLGYLVQRSIGYGLRWRSGVEDSGTVPVAAAAGGRPVVAEAGWSPVAAGAMEGAWERAERRGDERARGLDLLAAIVTDPQARAVEVLRRAGVDARALLLRIESAFDVEDEFEGEFELEFGLDFERYVGGGDPGCRSNR